MNSDDLIFREISFREVVAQTEKKFQSSIIDKQLKFSSELNINSPYNSYPEILAILLDNLIENGIDFNSVGGELKIFIAAAEESIVLEVMNTGEGIHEDSISNVFEMFYRGSNRSKGNGLGLYIAKKAVEKLSGKIFVKDASPNATIISVTLPYEIG